MIKSILFGYVYIFCTTMSCIHCYYGAENLITSFDQPVVMNCTDLSPQRSIDIERTVGTWYGYEVFMHNSNLRGGPALNPCVVVQLSDATKFKDLDEAHEEATERAERAQRVQPQADTGFEEYHNRQVFLYDLPHKNPYGSRYFHYLKLEWSEQGKKIDYTLRYNTSRPGLWYSAAPERGTMQSLNYGQFDGTIQALIAQDKYMILTFCLDRLFSIILTREPKILAIEDLQNIRILLKNRGLSVVEGRGDCNIASNTIGKLSILALLSSSAIAFLFKYL